MQFKAVDPQYEQRIEGRKSGSSVAWLGADWDQLAAEGIVGVNMLYDTTAFVKRADLALSGAQSLSS